MFRAIKQNKTNYDHVTSYELRACPVRAKRFYGVTSYIFAFPFLLIMVLILLLPFTASATDQLDFKPQVGIPGSQFQQGATLPVFSNLVMLAMYIKSIYSYLIGISGIAAAIAIMVGGVFWLTAGGDSGKIKEAQAYIQGGLMGLILIIASYTILTTINPSLVSLNTTAIKNVSDTSTSKTEGKKFPILSQIVPGAESFDLGSLECSDGQCSTTWIAQTVNGVYRYALGIVGIVVAVVLIIGGLFWMTSGGDAGKVSQAQDYIKGAVMGLVLVICSYTILYQLNPMLIDFKITGISTIEIFEIDSENSIPDTPENNNAVKIIESSGSLVTVDGIKSSRPIQLRQDVAQRLIQAQNIAKDKYGVELYITSSYRSYEHQKRLWEAALIKYGSASVARKWVAPPGRSEHQLGTAVDVFIYDTASSKYVGKQGSYSDSSTKLLAQIMSEAGFTNYPAEFWHWSIK